MKIKVYRLTDGEDEARDAQQVSTELSIPFGVMGAATKEEAWVALYANVPRSYHGMIFNGARSSGYKDDIWEFQANYKESSDGGSTDDENAEPTLSFDCSGGAKRVQYAISQRRVYAAENAKDAGNAIGWNGKTGSELEIAGVDIPTGQMRETYTKTMRMSALTTSFRRRINACVGKVNSSMFKGWDPGEVMFLGMGFSGNLKGAEKIQVSFNFQIQPNEEKAEINGIDCGKVLGFEYIWCIPKAARGSESLAKVDLEAVYVAKVVYATDFKIFGL